MLCKRSSKKRGVLLLISIMITSVVLTIAMMITSVTTRQISLASGAKPAQVAFYAADSGVNCALYWDLRHPLYDESIFRIKPNDARYVYSDPATDSDPVSCYNFNFAKGSGNTWLIANVGGGWETDFSFKLDPDQTRTTAPCVTVKVRKVWTDTVVANGFIDPGEVETFLTGTGYSSCDATNARRAQRVLQQRYR